MTASTRCMQAACLASALALAGCNVNAPELLELLAGTSRDAAQLSEDARVLQARGNRAAAVIRLKSAIAQRPDDPLLRYQLGRLYIEGFDGISAEKELNRAIELGMDATGEIAVALARSMWLQGAYQRLIQNGAPTARDPRHRAEIQGYRSYALAALGDVEASRQLIAELSGSAEGKDLPMTALAAARIELTRGNAAGALENIEPVLVHHRDLYDALALKADVMRVNGSVQDAIAAYKDLLRIAPSNLIANVAVSSLLLSIGQVDEAARFINVLELNYPGHFLTHYQRGLLRFKKGQLPAALESFQVARKINGTFHAALLLEGTTQLASGNALSAERALSRYIAARPDDRQGRRMLGFALLQLNESTRALEVIAPSLHDESGGSDFWEIAGDAHARLGNYEQAMVWFRKVLEIKPDTTQVREKKALMHLRAGNTDSAIQELEQVAKIGERLVPADLVLASVHLARREFDQAARIVDAMERKSPGLAVVGNLRGVVLREQGHPDRAAAVFEDVLKRHPAFLPAATNLAKLDMRSGDPERARRRFQAVLSADKNHMQALLILADIEQQYGRTEQAIALLDRAADGHPAALEPRIRLVGLLSELGRAQSARERADETLSRNPSNPVAYELLGLLQLRQGEGHSAVATFARLVNAYPKLPQAYLLKGRAEFAVGLKKDAESSLRRAIDLDPSYRPGGAALVELLLQQGRHSAALEVARSLQTKSFRSPVGLELEGDIHLSQKNYPAAITAYRNALTRAPVDIIPVRLYQARVLGGDHATALEELRQWVAAHPDHPVSGARLAEVYLSSGDYRNAIRVYEALLKREPADPTRMNNLAWAYFKIGDERAAQLAEAAHGKMPANPYFSDTLGWILLSQGNVSRGKQLLTRAVKGLPEDPGVRFRYAAALAKSGDFASARQEVSVALSSNKTFPERADAIALLNALKP